MIEALKPKATEAFVRIFGSQPEQFYQAPGRVNLIGEHTDYNDGFVLPCAINHGTVIAASKRTDDKIVLIACDYDDARSEFDLNQPLEKKEGDEFWSNYIRGTTQALMNKGHKLTGANLVITGDVPQGTGLSSSASLEVATGTALCHLSGITLPGSELALAGQSAENDFVGSNTGIMDQMISACGKDDHAMMLDCRSLETTPVSMPEKAAVVIVNSNVRRGLVDSEYNTRRQNCEDAARILGVKALRDANIDLLNSHRESMDEVSYKRAHHIITENQRTTEAAKALAAGDLTRMGELMAQSHISMAQDFEITVPAIDILVDIIASTKTDGGVRMTGGGFGGCVVALVPETDIPAIKEAVARQYPEKTGLQGDVYICQASCGAGVIASKA
ncbi:galactokinase [Sansalvadorimonas verongulae]|uniref:galactokinase n=1 Tax=Sansalvadorimonas verongulae TaxID=2172824 RepID=UPI0012BC6691|nr:galactokinase [Sansalvadorimonas verongulae]MTI15205.1 galactokinase [Sansalvadorimonas verongulae]